MVRIAIAAHFRDIRVLEDVWQLHSLRLLLIDLQTLP